MKSYYKLINIKLGENTHQAQLVSGEPDSEDTPSIKFSTSTLNQLLWRLDAKGLTSTLGTLSEKATLWRAEMLARGLMEYKDSGYYYCDRGGYELDHNDLISQMQPLAGKMEVVDRAIRFLRRYQEIEALLEKASKRSATEGYIYLAYCDTGHYKIGWSVDPDKRIKHFDTQMPVEVSMVHSFPTDNVRAAETFLHYLFQDKRINGEWFDLSESEIEFICAIYEWCDCWPLYYAEDKELMEATIFYETFPFII